MFLFYRAVQILEDIVHIEKYGKIANTFVITVSLSASAVFILK